MISRIGAGTHFHAAVRHGDTLHLSGVVAADLTAPMRVQTEQVLDRIREVLTRCGSDASKILSATVYLSDFAAKEEMNAAWRAWFDSAHLPARATVGVATLGPGVLIEVSVVAAA